MGAATVPQAQGKPASQGPWLGVLSPRCRLCAHHLAVCARRPPAPPLTGVVAGDGSLSDCRLPGSPDPVVSQSKLTGRHGARAPTPTCRTRTRQFLRLRPAVCTLCRSHPPSVHRQPGLKREHRTSSFQRGYLPSNESGQVLDATSLPHGVVSPRAHAGVDSKRRRFQQHDRPSLGGGETVLRAPSQRGVP